MKSDRHVKKAVIPYLLLLPSVAVTILFLVIPGFFLLSMSFTEGSSFFFEKKVTMDNYVQLVVNYRDLIWNTVFIALTSAIIDLIFGYPFAYFLYKRFPFKTMANACMVFPLFGGLYLAFGLYYLLLPKGILYPLFQFFGLNVLNILYSKISVIFGLAIFTFPFMALNIMGSLKNIDPFLEEAALCLGARTFGHFLKSFFHFQSPEW